MAKIPSEVIDDIRERSNIVEIVGQYVQLKKSGKNYLGLCPFHSEKTPSFSVAEDKQIFHCFGCGKGGNVFRFIQEIEHISFSEAVLKVADIEQLPIDTNYRRELSNPKDDQSSPFVKMHEKAAEFYHHMLVNTAVGQPVVAYLHERGITDEVIDLFQIGFSPPQRSFLERIFKNEHFSSDKFNQSGLFVEREDGELIDRFYQRIMFPIRNEYGRTIAFSGRWFELDDTEKSDQPKYLNSPETAVFNKRDVLFNLDKAKGMIRKESTVYLFEGFMDVIAAWQADIQNGVASMGTSLTEQQIQKIQRVANNLVFCYDGDVAGQNATYKGLQLLHDQSRLKLSVVQLPEKLDPDEFVQKYGKESFHNLAQHEQVTPFVFTMKHLESTYNMQNEKERLLYLEMILKELAKVDSLIEQDRYLTKLAERFEVQRETIVSEFRKIKQSYRKDIQREYSKQEQIQQVSYAQQPIVRRRKTQVQKAEELLLYRMMFDKEYRMRFRESNIGFIEDYYQQLYLLMDTYILNEGAFDLAKFLDFILDENLKNLVIAINTLSVSEEGSTQEFEDLVHQLSAASLVDQIERKKQEQKEASRVGDQDLQIKLAMDIISLTKRLKQKL